MYGCQCPKRLFLHKRRPELRNEEDEQQQSIFSSGTTVGQLAKQFFPGGQDATPPDSFSYQMSVETTKRLIKQGESIIYEAAFQYEGVLCALDILVKKGNAWHAFEVKSTTSVKSQHIQDAALQYYVVTHCGIPLEDISTVYLNNQYVRQGALDVQQLFATQSILEDVLEQQVDIIDKVQELKALITQPNEPVVDIGQHCFDPYGCDFTDHCWSHVPKQDSIFDLPGKYAWRLYANGHRLLLDIPEDFEMTAKPAMQLKHYRSGEVHIAPDAIREFLEPLTYPLYFFDFETIMPAIPEFDGSRPYQQIPFQYSLHIQRSPGSELEHYEFLGDGINDPREDLTHAMIRYLGNTGNIICYNMSFERSRIKELANLFAHYESELLAINERVVDLMVPFAKRWYYHPNFKGSYSIKVVLPVLIPELRYSDLVIKEGGKASLVYSQLKGMDADIATQQLHHLLEYCKMDTLAMVRILDFIKALTAKISFNPE